MTIHKFEDIIAWQKAQDFAVEIYAVFRTNKDWEFRRQICRAVVSVSNNIAEGFERNSDRDFRRFLLFAQASCGEVHSMLYLARRLEYINQDLFLQLTILSKDTSRLIKGFIKHLDANCS